MFGALIADSEKLHDPRLYHDRLILGLTGMMSEAELHQIRTRLHAGGRQKAERGELRIFLPAGLWLVKLTAQLLSIRIRRYRLACGSFLISSSSWAAPGLLGN